MFSRIFGHSIALFDSNIPFEALPNTFEHCVPLPYAYSNVYDDDGILERKDKPLVLNINFG